MPEARPVPEGVRAVGAGTVIVGGLFVVMYAMNISVRERGAASVRGSSDGTDAAQSMVAK